jgi:glyoxylase I family protein
VKLHHLAFRTTDVDGLVRFYREVLGFAEVRDSRPRSVWLAIGDDAVLMVEASDAGEPPNPDASMELVAFATDTEGKDRTRVEALRRGCFDGETDFTVYLRDPEGRRIGVSTYTFDRN